MRSFEEFIDKRGFVTMLGGEAGDALQKTTFLGVAQMLADPNEYKPLMDDGSIAVLESEVKSGIYVRHPDQSQWYSNPENCSRDQVSSMIVWAGFKKQPKRILRQLWQQIKRFGFYQNKYPNHAKPGDIEYKAKIPDFMGPADFMEYFRALYLCGGWYRISILMYPVACLSDFQVLVGVITKVVGSYINPDSSDHDNIIMEMMQINKSFHTPLSYLAKLIYFKLCPILGYTDETKTIKLRNTKTLIRTGPASAVLWKHRESVGAPPLGEYWVSKGLL